MGTIANIICGAITSIGVDLTPLTTLINTYVDMGFTQEGLDMEFEVELQDIFVDQLAVPVKRLVVQLNVKFTLNLAEGNSTNLTNGIPTASVNAGDVEYGQQDGSDVLQNLAIEIVGDGPAASTRTIIVPLATPTGNVGIPFKRDGVQMLPVEFGALSDGVNPLVLITDV